MWNSPLDSLALMGCEDGHKPSSGSTHATPGVAGCLPPAAFLAAAFLTFLTALTAFLAVLAAFLGAGALATFLAAFLTGARARGGAGVSSTAGSGLTAARVGSAVATGSAASSGWVSVDGGAVDGWKGGYSAGSRSLPWRLVCTTFNIATTRPANRPSHSPIRNDRRTSDTVP